MAGRHRDGAALERRIALIPRVEYMWGGNSIPGEYALYLTDQRMIFCEEKSPTEATVIGGPLQLGAVLAAADASLKEVRTRDYAMATPEELATTPSNVVIWHWRLYRIELHRVFGKVNVQVFFSNRRVLRDAQFNIVAPDTLLTSRKKEGQGAGKTRTQYSMKAQQALQRALPPDVVGRSKWLH